ncbi:MAG: ABC transporter permease [Firmicutes bacterium]|nr:ABC transporter permease [Bacillota bacterium]
MSTATAAKPRKKGQFKEVVRRYKKSRLAMAGLIIFTFILIMAIAAPAFGSYQESITQHIKEKLTHPNSEHWFGTDAYGRDIFLRCLYGARISLIIGITSSMLAMLAGSLIGLTAGYYGGTYDTVIMRFCDVMSAIPTILLAICVVAALGSSTINLVLALAISRVAAFSRIVRSSTLGQAGMEYVEAAKAGGTSALRIMVRHIYPNILGPTIVQFTTNIAGMILQTASLSYLGLGVAAPTPEWGAIIGGGQGYLRAHPYMVVLPGICIILASLSINLIGDGLRDALDPRLKS